MGDAGRRIDDHYINTRGECTEGLHEAEVFSCPHIHHVRGAGGGGHHQETLGRGDENFIQRALAAEHVGEGVTRREAEKYVGVGQPQVTVEQHYTLAAFGERRGEVDGNAGFSDTALTAGDGDDLDGLRQSV